MAYWEMVWQLYADQFGPGIANFLETYEVLVFGSVSDYIAVAFFNGSRSVSWFTFATSWIARPFGGLLFGGLADHSGRRVALLTSFYMAFAATLSLGLAPTVPYLGPSWIVLCRVLQGIGQAGLLGSSGVLLSESAPRPVLGQTGGVIQVSGVFGFMSATGVTAVYNALLTPTQMQNWGWRLAFLTAALPGALALYWVQQTSESPEFEHAQKDDSGQAALSHGIQGAIATHAAQWPAAVLAFAGSLWSHCAVGMIVYLPAWLATKCHATTLQAFSLSLGGQCLTLLLVLPTGWLADTFGLAKTNIALHAFAMASAVPMFASLLHGFHSDAVLFVAACGVPAVWLALKSLTFPWLCELFPFGVRGSLFALSYNLSAVAGGLTPFICTQFSSITLFPAYYTAAVSGVSLTAFVICLVLHEAHKEDPRRLQVVHLRADPY